MLPSEASQPGLFRLAFIRLFVRLSRCTEYEYVSPDDLRVRWLHPFY